jgi:hypothetical protein
VILVKVVVAWFLWLLTCGGGGLVLVVHCAYCGDGGLVLVVLLVWLNASGGCVAVLAVPSVGDRL